MIRNQENINRAVRIAVGVMLIALVFFGSEVWSVSLGLLLVVLGLAGFLRSARLQEARS